MQIDQRILCPAQNRLSIVSVEIAAGDKVFASVTPIQFFRFETDCQRVRPSEAVLDDDTRRASVQTGLSDMRPFAPICPVNIAGVWIDSDSARLLQVLIDQHFAILAVQLRHFDRIQTLVAPIQILCHPIDCQAIGILQ